MQKVVGSSPIIRFEKPPETGFFFGVSARRRPGTRFVNRLVNTTADARLAVLLRGPECGMSLINAFRPLGRVRAARRSEGSGVMAWSVRINGKRVELPRRLASINQTIDPVGVATKSASLTPFARRLGCSSHQRKQEAKLATTSSWIQT
jgi:hypothetical protein